MAPYPGTGRNDQTFVTPNYYRFALREQQSSIFFLPAYSKGRGLQGTEIGAREEGWAIAGTGGEWSASGAYINILMAELGLVMGNSL